MTEDVLLILDLINHHKKNWSKLENFDVWPFEVEVEAENKFEAEVRCPKENSRSTSMQNFRFLTCKTTVLWLFILLDLQV